jgi:predicted nucleotidyltransferase
MSDAQPEQLSGAIRDALDAAPFEISHAYLFGSHARGDYTPESDYDIALIADGFAGTPLYERGHWFKREWPYVEVGNLDLLCYTPEEFDARVDEELSTALAIVEEGVEMLNAGEKSP